MYSSVAKYTEAGVIAVSLMDYQSFIRPNIRYTADVTSFLFTVNLSMYVSLKYFLVLDIYRFN